MKIILMVSLFFLTGCTFVTNQPESPQDRLRDLGPAPELTSDTWLNTDQPLRPGDLRGKVVLLEMWTFGCSNCLNTIPQLNTWYETYAGQGLIIIGNHYPEFTYEADLANLEKAVQDLGIKYPLVQDNDGSNWKAYGNTYWPTIYLIDKFGRIRYIHIGEGAYDITEAAIRDLLAVAYP